MTAPYVSIDAYGAILYNGEIPGAVLAQLPGLYSSTYSLPEYFALFYPEHALSALVLDEPRHVLVFYVDGDTAVVVSRLVSLDPTSADRCCRAAFVALPHVVRVFIELQFDPRALTLSARPVRTLEDIVVRLPRTTELYRASLGTATRRNAVKWVNRLNSRLPDAGLRVHEDAQVDDSLVHAILQMSRTRVEARGDRHGVDAEYERRLAALARHCGFVTTLEDHGQLLAGLLCTRVGRQYYAHVTGFNPEYESLRPGELLFFLTINESVRRGGSAFHFLWGRQEYKFRLGGSAQGLWQTSVYRSRGQRLLHLGEAARRDLHGLGFGGQIRSLASAAMSRARSARRDR